MRKQAPRKPGQTNSRVSSRRGFEGRVIARGKGGQGAVVRNEANQLYGDENPRRTVANEPTVAAKMSANTERRKGDDE